MKGWYKSIENKIRDIFGPGTNMRPANTVREKPRPLTGFPPIEKEIIAEKHSIKKNGGEDGDSNYPSSDSSQLSHTENVIISEVMDYGKKIADQYDWEIQGIEQKYDKHVAELNVEKTSNEEIKYRDKAKQVKKLVEGKLGHVADQLRSRGQELLTFRRKHRLMERLPVIQDAYLMLSLGLLVFTFEVIVTFFLTLESGPPMTLAIIVLLYCALNFWSPFFFGGFLKGMFYQPIDRTHLIIKISCGFLTVLLIVLLLMLNLGMGHYRSVGLNMEDSASISAINSTDTVDLLLHELQQHSRNLRVAFDNFIANPFGIMEILSWLLVILGWVLSIVAFIDGMLRNERYPQYGRLHNEYKAVYGYYVSEMESFSSQMIEIRQEAIDYIDVKKGGVKNAMSSIPKIVKEAEVTFRKFTRARTNLYQDCKELFSLYRSENTKARTTRVPDYFGDDPSLELPGVEQYTPKRIDQGIDEEKILLDHDDLANSIHTDINMDIESIPSVFDVMKDIGDPLRIEDDDKDEKSNPSEPDVMKDIEDSLEAEDEDTGK